MKIGVDLTFMPRFAGKDRLAKEILSNDEYALYSKSLKKEQYLASRFALKEAFIKATEQSILGLNLREIETRKKDSGAIYIVYKNKEYSCSLSHENEYCIGVVLND